MKIEKIKNSQNLKGYVLFIISLLLIFLSSYLFYKSYALYEEQKDFNVINGTVEEAGDIYFAYYIDGVISRNMPLQNTGYTLDETKSNCNNNVIVKWDNASWEAKVNYKNYSATDNTRTKCTLYFNKTAKTVKTALGNIEVTSYTPDFTKSACDDSSCESHEKGIYETTDTDGKPTYYYRGSVENNYVKFAGFYWRIIRINSNGSIRMIYDGTVAHQNGEASDDRQNGTSVFNQAYDNNMYVGYMYTEGEAHGTKTSSTIKTNVDKFYKDKLINYSLYVDETIGYCNDRSVLSYNSTAGVGREVTYYKAYVRVEESVPTLICENESDYYTMASTSSGNKKLSYPIGLISIDEAMFAGYAGGIVDGSYNNGKKNVNSYLFSGKEFWSMTSSGYYVPYFQVIQAKAFSIGTNKGFSLDDSGVYAELGLKVVINIRSDVTITGNGTINDPYLVN